MSGAPSDNEPTKRFDRFRDDLRNLEQRWDNRLVLEKSPLGEQYLNGRFEIIVYGERCIGIDKVDWICRIHPRLEILDDGAVDDGIYVRELGSDHRWDEQIVLVVVVELAEKPPVFVRAVLRPYLVEQKDAGSGEGLLYRSEVFGGYKVLPKFIHREVDFGARIDRSDNSSGKMVECAPEVMDHISDDQRKQFWDWLQRTIGQSTTPRLIVGGSQVRLDLQGIQGPVEGAAKPDQFIDVLIGPLNL